MAGSSRYTALLDSCVLYSAVVRDVLMLLARDFYSAKWTVDIEGEWSARLLENRPDLNPDRVARTRELMRAAVPDWEVTGYQSLLAEVDLPDPGDRHVLAAAIRGHADCIVSANRKDFPIEVLARHDLELFHPDDFVMLQLDLRPVEALKIFKQRRQSLRNPAMTSDEFIDSLERSGLVRTAARLREDIELL